jgi:hypothetical protein
MAMLLVYPSGSAECMMRLLDVPLSSRGPNLVRAAARGMLAGACLLPLLMSGCAKSPPANTPPVGRITVGVTTTAPNIDIAPMTFVVEIQPGGTREAVRADAGVYDEEVPPGEYLVRLTGLARGCRVDGPSERGVVVSARRATAVRFSVTCRNE